MASRTTFPEDATGGESLNPVEHDLTGMRKYRFRMLDRVEPLKTGCVSNQLNSDWKEVARLSNLTTVVSTLAGVSRGRPAGDSLDGAVQTEDQAAEKSTMRRASRARSCR